jgi:GTPase Era involved in 16S rRNA processing
VWPTSTPWRSSSSRSRTSARRSSCPEPDQENGVPAILVINKIDTIKKEALLGIIGLYAGAHPFEAIVPVSAKKGDGVGLLLEEFKKYAEEGPQLFPDGMVTDQPEKQVVAEIVREKLLMCLEREVPHGTAVEVTRFSERDDGVIDLDVTIYCEKSSHKGMIIGKNGAMLKKIGTWRGRTSSALWARRCFCRHGSRSRKTGATATDDQEFRLFRIVSSRPPAKRYRLPPYRRFFGRGTAASYNRSLHSPII